MTRRMLSTAAALAVFSVFVQMPAFAQDDPDVYVSTGSSGEILLGLDGTDYQQAFTANGGFKPEEIAFAGDGSLYICDASNSEIFRLQPGVGLVTIYDRNSATSPNNPEQPKGCVIAGDDLLFLSRNGNGKNAKTGLWSIQNATGVSPGKPIPLLGLDAVGGASGHGLTVNFDGRVFFTFGTEIWVATPQPGAGRVDENADFQLWGYTASEGFGIATRGVPDPSAGALQTQVFVAAKFSGVIEVFKETAAAGGALPGSSSGCSVIDVPDMPNSLDIDGSGDLWVAVSAQSSGRRGAVYEVDSPECRMGPFMVTSRGDGLSGALGIALTPTGSAPVTLTFPEGADKSNVVNLCNSTFNLDQVTTLCQDTWTVSCRLLPDSEFETRTGYAIGSPTAGDPGDLVEDDFSFTQCADFPGASGNCTEIRIKQVTDTSQCSENDIISILANWQFYSLSNLNHPGLLYSPGDFPTDGGGTPIPENAPFSENILVDYDPVPVPTDPLDPRATGSRDAWGSGIIVVEDAPNRPPTAVLKAFVGDATEPVPPDTPIAAQCGVPVTFDGAGSFDNDWNVDHADSITNWKFTVDGAVQQSAMIDFYVFDTSGLAAGDYPVELEVTDEGWDVNGPLTDSASATLTILADNDAPVINTFALVNLGHPQAEVAGDGQSATMWPPNHEMVPFQVLYDAYDACAVDCSLVITSNEPDNGTGDGDIAPDFEITGESAAAFFFNLRAERAQNGDGRTYTVQMTCSDGTNSSTSSLITVFVPASQSGE